MPINNRKSSSKKKQLNDYARYSAVGFQMAAIIFLFTWGGNKIDGWLEFKIPVFTLVLSLSAVTISIYLLIKETSGKKE
ncbi:MAG TPA: AtpZ/AtpI family protein [Bacteroidia bacterium]|nr:AtpZ/AtpI family protein [Bacteroidia bacterium]